MDSHKEQAAFGSSKKEIGSLIPIQLIPNGWKDSSRRRQVDDVSKTTRSLNDRHLQPPIIWKRKWDGAVWFEKSRTMIRWHRHVTYGRSLKVAAAEYSRQLSNYCRTCLETYNLQWEQMRVVVRDIRPECCSNSCEPLKRNLSNEGIWSKVQRTTPDPSWTCTVVRTNIPDDGKITTKDTGNQPSPTSY